METREISRRKFFALSAGAVGVVGAAGVYLRWRRASTAVAGPSPSQSDQAAGSIADAARTLGHDVTSIFTFVRDEIRYEPYVGALRGATGTLLAGSGNSVDQALLLADLLKANSMEVRFVSGQLDARAADVLLASTVVDAEKARQYVDRAFMSSEDLARGVNWSRVASASRSDASRQLPRLDDLRAAFAKDVKAFEPVAARQLGDSVTIITKALSAAGITLPAGTTVLPSAERTAHTWVQVKGGSAWVDLDPAFPDAKPGKAMAASGSPVSSIADDLRQKVTFTVIAESVQGGELKRDQLLEMSSFVDELSTTNMTFAHLPADRASGIDLLKGGNGGGKRYHPVLVIGEKVHIGRQPVSVGTAVSAQDAIADAFGGGGGGVADGETSAEWLEVSLTSPGSQATVVRREIFDRVGIAARRKGRPTADALSPAELVDVKDGEGPHYLPCRSVWAFHVSGSVVNLKSALENVRTDGAPPLSLLPASYHALREMVGAALCTRAGCRPFDEAAQISSWVFEPTKDGFAQGLDIWHRGAGTLALPGAGPMAPPALIAGVLSHVVERLIVGDATDRASVGAIFERAAAEGIQPRVFRGRLPDDASYEPQHRARIQAALESGRIVVAPERAIDFGGRLRMGWWLIDPQTGAAVDELDNGRGAMMQGGTGEYIVVAPAAAATGVALSNYGWHMWNLGQRYIASGGVNSAQVSQVMNTLANLLLALCPPGTPCQ